MADEYLMQYEQGLHEQALRVTGKPRYVLDWEMQQYINEQVEQRR
jgi:hypothetical protein